MLHSYSPFHAFRFATVILLSENSQINRNMLYLHTDVLCHSHTFSTGHMAAPLSPGSEDYMPAGHTPASADGKDQGRCCNQKQNCNFFHFIHSLYNKFADRNPLSMVDTLFYRTACSELSVSRRKGDHGQICILRFPFPESFHGHIRFL